VAADHPATMTAPPFDPQRFDLASLRLFVHVLESGSLTGGAVRLGVSVAAASRRIAELEALVGVPLVSRGARGVSPTAAGLTLQRHAVELVSGVEQLALAMADYHRGVQGHLRLWANPSAFNGFLPRRLAEFAQACPAVKIDLEDALSEDAVRAVAGGVAELAVIGEGTPAAGLETHVCDIDELVLVTPRSHPLDAGEPQAPVALAEVLRFDMVALSRATSLSRTIAAEAAATGRGMRVRVHTRSFDAMCRMVAAGMGVAILPRTGADALASSLGLRLRPLTGMRTERRLLLAMRRRADLGPAARAFVDLVLPA
jgi:DNA-binding transcriptional LysR family regulator